MSRYPATRIVSKLDVPDCPCMLCASNGMIDASDINPAPRRAPTIFCRFIHLWREQSRFCCCLSHPDCDFKIAEDCDPECPRCCPCNFEKTPCDRCKAKDKVFYQCFHEKGVCKSYKRKMENEAMNVN